MEGGERLVGSWQFAVGNSQFAVRKKARDFIRNSPPSPLFQYLIFKIVRDLRREGRMIQTNYLYPLEKIQNALSSCR